MSDDDPTLTAHVAAARTAWPTLALDDYPAWLRTQAEALAKLATFDPREVALCWAAGFGDPEAHRLFEQHYMTQIAVALRRFSADSSMIDEVAQRVRVKLLVPRSGHRAAAILDYAFGGQLAGLVRVAAVREAVSLRRGEKPRAPVEELEDLVGEVDPQLAALKHRYATELQQAFSAAVSELPARDRQLLRLSISMRASIDDIARIYNTHRATAARWLNTARDALADTTRRHLQTQLRLPEPELTSLLRLVRTEATRMFQSIPADPDD